MAQLLGVLEAPGLMSSWAGACAPLGVHLARMLSRKVVSARAQQTAQCKVPHQSLYGLQAGRNAFASTDQPRNQNANKGILIPHTTGCWLAALGAGAWNRPPAVQPRSQARVPAAPLLSQHPVSPHQPPAQTGVLCRRAAGQAGGAAVGDFAHRGSSAGGTAARRSALQCPGVGGPRVSVPGSGWSQFECW